MFWVIWSIIYLFCSLAAKKDYFGHSYLVNSLIVVIPLAIAIFYIVIKKAFESTVDNYNFMILDAIQQHVDNEEFVEIIDFAKDYLLSERRLYFIDALFLFIENGKFKHKERILMLNKKCNLLKLEKEYVERINRKYISCKLIQFKNISINKIFSDYVFLLYKADKNKRKKLGFYAILVSIMMLLLVFLTLFIDNTSIILVCSIFITIISWCIYKRIKSKSFTDNLYFLLFWIVDILVVCSLPAIKNNNICFSQISIMLVGVKVTLSMIFGTKTLQVINEGSINIKNSMLDNYVLRVDNLLFMKIYAISKKFLLWLIMGIVILFNIIIFAAINYFNDFIYSFTYGEYFFSSVANYFTNTAFITGIGKVGDITSFTNLIQSVVAFFTNIIFIEKIVEYVLKDNMNIEI